MAAQTEISLPAHDSPFCSRCATRMVFVREWSSSAFFRTGQVMISERTSCPQCQHEVVEIMQFP
jgi:endogenous inhibitor of DNA gyrase (YacG/DUF329 family)